ncbi:MAG TPA: hypothetical protein VIK11_00525 [Tepidiformaceae bacterium]
MHAILIDHLPKIALLIEQTYADHRNTQIAGGFELIAGHIAQSTRVDRQRFAQHEFHTEIGNTSQRRLRVGLLKPRRRLRCSPPGLHEIVNVLAESGISESTLEFLSRDRLYDGPGVIREFPEHRVQPPPHLVSGMIPRRSHVQGKLGQ